MNPHEDDRPACLQKRRVAGLLDVAAPCGKCGGNGSQVECAEIPREERARIEALLIRARAAVAAQRELRELASQPLVEFSSAEALFAEAERLGRSTEGAP